MYRYAKLVDTPEARVDFMAQYRSSDGVEIWQYEYDEWLVLHRPLESVVIPIIAFIEGEMELPMGRVTRDFLINYRLTPTKYSPNVFRILRYVDILNRKMGTYLTWHDVNWVYNWQKGEKTKYYIKCRVLTVRLISYLPDSSKGMDEDFLIISGDWHDGMHCPNQEGEPGRVLEDRSHT